MTFMFLLNKSGRLPSPQASWIPAKAWVQRDLNLTAGVDSGFRRNDLCRSLSESKVQVTEDHLQPHQEILMVIYDQ